MYMFTEFVKFVMMLFILIVCFTTAKFMCVPESHTTVTRVVYDLILPYSYHVEDSSTTSTHMSAYVCLLEVVFKLALCLLLAAFIASVVRQIIHITPYIEDLWRVYVGRILLLIERRLPIMLCKRGYIEIDGRYYIVVSQTKPELLHRRIEVVSGSESSSDA